MRKIIYIGTFLVLILIESLQGQYAFNSPYSSVGFGDLSFKGFGRNRAMGGITTALRDPASIDFFNPAALSVRDTLSFIFDFGGTGKLSYLSDKNNEDIPWDVNFSHMAFSFPLNKKIALAGGVIPFSLVEYQAVDQIREGNADFNPEIGNYDYLYKGQGGLNKIFFGSGMQVTKKISLGLNVNYIFGNLKKIQSITYIEIPNAFHPKTEEEYIVSGFNYNFGAQYQTSLGKDVIMILGANYTPGNKLNQTSNMLKSNVLITTGGGSVSDTLESTSSGKVKAALPSSFGAGISFNKDNKLLFGFDYKATQWSESTLMGNDSLLNSQSFHAGIEFTPDPRRLKSYLNQIHYRLGSYYTNSYLHLNGDQINDFGITFGVGLPVPQSRSTFNIAFELGKRGTTNDNLILENHAAITFSLTMYEFWFQKRKYE